MSEPGWRPPARPRRRRWPLWSAGRGMTPRWGRVGTIRKDDRRAGSWPAETVQPTSSSTSAAARTAARARAHMPSMADLTRRLCALRKGPRHSGSSRRGEQVRYFYAMASRVRRRSARCWPRTGSAGISGSIRSHIASVITNRTDTSDQLITHQRETPKLGASRDPSRPPRSPGAMTRRRLHGNVAASREFTPWQGAEQ